MKSKWKKINKFISDTSKRNNLLLDIGCGEGKKILRFTKGTVIGVDVDRNEVIKAQSFANINHVDGNYIIADAECLPFRNSIANSILVVDVLEHVRHYRSVLEEVGRVLCHRGCMLIDGPNPFNPFHFLDQKSRFPGLFASAMGIYFYPRTKIPSALEISSILSYTGIQSEIFYDSEPFIVPLDRMTILQDIMAAIVSVVSITWESAVSLPFAYFLRENIILTGYKK